MGAGVSGGSRDNQQLHDRGGGGLGGVLETPSAEGIKNVTVMVSASGLAPGKHAVHIHEIGACAPTCAAAGSHVDLGPFGNNLPVIANHPYHSGDLINLPIASNGTGSMTHVTSRIAITPGNLSIFDGDGAAIVIHALPDAYCAENPADPNCAGGGRVACGVLRAYTLKSRRGLDVGARPAADSVNCRRLFFRRDGCRGLGWRA